VGRVTELVGENLTLSTGFVLVAFQSAAVNNAAAHVLIKRIEISQHASTTLAMVRGELATRNTAGTLTMTAATPRNIRPLDGPASGLTGNTAPAGGTARSGVNSSADSGGTYASIHPFAFANTAGYLYKPDPTEEILVPPSTLFVVRFLAAPSILGGWDIVLVLDEN